MERKWYHNIWITLLLVFFALGPLGLPLVWKNPNLSRPMKIGLTLVIIAYTLILIQLTVSMVQSVLKSVESLDAVLR